MWHDNGLAFVLITLTVERDLYFKQGAMSEVLN